MPDPARPEAAFPPAMSAEEIELQWYRTVYQGDHVPQLTLRAVVTGWILGALMAFSNLYVGLKAGWSIGVVVTAAILSYSIHRFLHALFPRYSPISILENNCTQSTASAGGYGTGGTIVSAIPAYLMITGHHMDPWTLAIWTFFIAMIGVFMAIPMKRQLVNVERLPFPTGIAAAETLKSLHTRGVESARKAKALFSALGLGLVIKWFNGSYFPFMKSVHLDDPLHVPGNLRGHPLSSYTVGIDGSTILMAAGAIIGVRTTFWMLAGGFLNFVLLAPPLVESGVIPQATFGNIQRHFSVWPGVALMVAAGLTAFALQWKTVKRAFAGLGAILRPGRGKSVDDPLARIEVPSSWFAAGMVVLGAGIVVAAWRFFDVSPLLGVLAVVMTFFLAIVASRATGETDITPIGPMGKVTQLTFGVLTPRGADPTGFMTTNLMTASITANAASTAGDLLTDLKSGYLLGANPRKQFIAQALGIFAGVAAIVWAFPVVVPDASALGTSTFPAPAAQTWKVVAELLRTGFSALKDEARLALGLAAAAGVVLTVLEQRLGARRRWVPSSMGLGLGFVIPFHNSAAFLAGALAAWLFARLRPKEAETYTIPVASGLIAGESLLGVALAAMAASRIMPTGFE
jgi:putative OPT family oligopeptide transporter